MSRNVSVYTRDDKKKKNYNKLKACIQSIQNDKYTIKFMNITPFLTWIKVNEIIFITQYPSLFTLFKCTFFLYFKMYCGYKYSIKLYSHVFIKPFNISLSTYLVLVYCFSRCGVEETEMLCNANINGYWTDTKMTVHTFIVKTEMS